MELELKLKITPFERLNLEVILKDYLRLKNPEFKRSRLTDDKERLLFAEDFLQKINI